MAVLSETSIVRLLREAAIPLSESPADYDPLLEAIGGARLVLLGEASHSTHEFYRERAVITERLIHERGFSAVAVEADWPDAYRVNRYVRGRSSDASPTEALAGFTRFPNWMWRNADALDFVGWLRDWNDTPSPDRRAGFYGLDLYSLFTSLEAVIGYLETVDRAAAAEARQRYACFEHFSEQAQVYGFAASTGRMESCEREVVEQLVELRRRAAEYASRDGQVAEEEYFYAEQNARLAKNAEAYYRIMYKGSAASWNLRDRHMFETLQELIAFLDARGGPTRAVVWAHNSHLGDARATEVSRRGELNLGQLVRERYGDEAFLVGFSTHDGTVTAAHDWDGPAERMQVRPSLPGSIERAIHETGHARALVLLGEREHVREALAEPRLERAIGVIYRPETERWSHYFDARVAEQFNALLHFDRTRAVEPLDPGPAWRGVEPPEAYPLGGVTWRSNRRFEFRRGKSPSTRIWRGRRTRPASWCSRTGAAAAVTAHATGAWRARCTASGSRLC